MRTRYTHDAGSGMLVSRSGEVLAPSGFFIDADGDVRGEVVTITLDDAPRSDVGRGFYAFSSSTTVVPSERSEENNLTTPSPKATAATLEREAASRVWAYYLEVIPSQRTLDSKRERIIRNAIRLVGEEATKRAVLGLSRSPHHNGQNEQRKTYLEIRYALKGIGDESDEERIAKAQGWAHEYRAGRAGEPFEPAKRERLTDEISYTLGLSHHPEKERAKAAWRELTSAGYAITRLSTRPWVRVVW